MRRNEADTSVATAIMEWALGNLSQSYIKTALKMDRSGAGEDTAHRRLRPLVEKAAREYAKVSGGRPEKADVDLALEYVVGAYLSKTDGSYGEPRIERLVARSGRVENPQERFYVIAQGDDYYVADSRNDVRVQGPFTKSLANRIADRYNLPGTVLKVANPYIREGQVVEED